MKTISKLLIGLFVITVGSKSMAQEKISTDLKEFKITIEKMDNGLKMQSDKGSAWVDLSFNLSNDKSQAIDENGMTQLGELPTKRDLKFADYLFTITHTKEGISLTGIEGTAWKELSFSLQENGRQAIDQFGMTK
ncbi:MAG: hypothetical protein K9I35_01900 [Flavobacterium sp.]|nr:hypothetical protein [Flavobacterium sp.]